MSPGLCAGTLGKRDFRRVFRFMIDLCVRESEVRVALILCNAYAWRTYLHLVQRMAMAHLLHLVQRMDMAHLLLAQARVRVRVHSMHHISICTHVTRLTRLTLRTEFLS